MPSSRIYGGHWVTQLALSYESNTSSMVLIPIQEIGTTALGKMRVLTRDGQQWRILDDDIVELLRQVEPEDIPKHAFVRRQRPRYVEPDHPETT